MTLEIYGRSPKGASARIYSLATMANYTDYSHGATITVEEFGTAAPESRKPTSGIKPSFL